MARPGFVILLAFLGEGVLALAGLLWILIRRVPFSLGDPTTGTIVGLTTAVALAAIQYVLLHHAPPVRPVRALRRMYRSFLRPLFRRVTPLEIVAISLLAGLGEEILFRGAIQPEWGWFAASVLFGLCHVGSRTTIVLGIWAALTGGLLGWLAIATGGLLAPIVAHAVYDALALSYIRWARPLPDPDGPARVESPDL